MGRVLIIVVQGGLGQGLVFLFLLLQVIGVFSFDAFFARTSIFYFICSSYTTMIGLSSTTDTCTLYQGVWHTSPLEMLLFEVIDTV